MRNFFVHYFLLSPYLTLARLLHAYLMRIFCTFFAYYSFLFHSPLSPSLTQVGCFFLIFCPFFCVFFAHFLRIVFLLLPPGGLLSPDRGHVAGLLPPRPAVRLARAPLLRQKEGRDQEEEEQGCHGDR